jgi:hypothetical protein
MLYFFKVNENIYDLLLWKPKSDVNSLANIASALTRKSATKGLLKSMKTMYLEDRPFLM